MAADTPTLDELYDNFSDVGSLKELFYDWHGLNDTLFFAINGFHRGWYDQLMLWITEVGNHKLFLYYVTIFAFYSLISTFAGKLAKRGGIKVHMAKWLGILTVMLVGYGAMGLTVKTIKDELAFPRPYEVHGTQKVEVLQPQPPEKRRQSFPSGHSAFAAFMLMALWPALGGGMRFIGLVVVLAVAYSRIALGVHFPADVVGGLTFGFIITWLVRIVMYNIYRKLFRIPC